MKSLSKGQALRKELALEAQALKENTDKLEKCILVNEDVYNRCLEGMPSHHRNTHLKRGFLRTYHKPFWVSYGEEGSYYYPGVVYIVNKDSEKNQTYEIRSTDKNATQRISIAVKESKHRIIEVKSVEGEVITVLSKQSWVLE